MPKIRVELEVDKDDCSYCPIFDEEYRVCDLFNCLIPYDTKTNNFKRCDKCKQAEVKDEHSND